jgi:hypothetical protein
MASCWPSRTRARKRCDETWGEKARRPFPFCAQRLFALLAVRAVRTTFRETPYLSSASLMGACLARSHGCHERRAVQHAEPATVVTPVTYFLSTACAARDSAHPRNERTCCESPLTLAPVTMASRNVSELPTLTTPASGARWRSCCTGPVAVDAPARGRPVALPKSIRPMT